MYAVTTNHSVITTVADSADAARCKVLSMWAKIYSDLEILSVTETSLQVANVWASLADAIAADAAISAPKTVSAPTLGDPGSVGRRY